MGVAVWTCAQPIFMCVCVCECTFAGAHHDECADFPGREELKKCGSVDD